MDTKIGPNGKAEKERHYTDHKNPKLHTNPHDHVIKWDNPNEHPEPQGQINYTDGVPEFKHYREVYLMANKIVPANTPEQNRFVSISDFKWCMKHGGEVEFVWRGIHYGVVRYGLDGKITLYVCDRPDTSIAFETADDALEYMVGSDRLRDVITQVTVIDRTI